MNKINHFFVKEPVWRDVSQWSLRAIPSAVISWLLESHSLTYRIKQTFADEFGVSLKRQALAKPFLSDAKSLAEPPHRYAVIREVVLHTGGQPLVFARTTLPIKVAQSLQELTHLGSRPLGEVIFSYPDLKRVKLDIAKVSCDQLNEQTQALLEGAPYIWARRNTYQINRREFLVSEFFLPALMNT